MMNGQIRKIWGIRMTWMKQTFFGFAFCFLFASVSFASIPDTYIEVSPELSYGVHDNGPAWIELVPMRGALHIDTKTSIKGGLSYSFEIPRREKPWASINHHGYRIYGEFEREITDDLRFFFEVNLGGLTEGATEDIQYLQTRTYQRVGLVWRLFRLL